MQHNRGFTLFELMVVIVILGVLAAVALPRFSNITKDAHEAAVRGAGGALASAVLLVRAQWEVNRSNGNDTTPNTDVVGFGDGTVDVNAQGWPVGTAGALNCVQVWNALLQGSASRVGTTSTPDNPVDYIASVTGAACTYTYQLDDLNDSIVYVSSNGSVTTNFDRNTP